MKQKLKNVEETLLIPLWARAEESKEKEPIIIDKQAVMMLESIDYDFSQFTGSWMSQVGCAVRASILDNQTEIFIKDNPKSTIINIGCGLDSRFFRVDNGIIHWYELDLPEPIEVRKQFFSETDRYHMIAQSVFDYSWIKKIKEKEQPILIIAEGIFMYFDHEQVKEIFNNLRKNFPEAHMLLEVTSKFIVKHSRKHETLKKMKDIPCFKWGIKSLDEIGEISIHIKILDSFNYFDFYKKRWRWLGKLAMIPFIKNNMNNKILKLRLLR